MVLPDVSKIKNFNNSINNNSNNNNNNNNNNKLYNHYIHVHQENTININTTNTIYNKFHSNYNNNNNNNNSNEILNINDNYNSMKDFNKNSNILNNNNNNQCKIKTNIVNNINNNNNNNNNKDSNIESNNNNNNNNNNISYSKRNSNCISNTIDITDIYSSEDDDNCPNNQYCSKNIKSKINTNDNNLFSQSSAKSSNSNSNTNSITANTNNTCSNTKSKSRSKLQLQQHASSPLFPTLLTGATSAAAIALATSLPVLPTLSIFLLPSTTALPLDGAGKTKLKNPTITGSTFAAAAAAAASAAVNGTGPVVTLKRLSTSLTTTILAAVTLSTATLCGSSFDNRLKSVQFKSHLTSPLILSPLPTLSTSLSLSLSSSSPAPSPSSLPLPPPPSPPPLTWTWTSAFETDRREQLSDVLAYGNSEKNPTAFSDIAGGVSAGESKSILRKGKIVKISTGTGRTATIEQVSNDNRLTRTIRNFATANLHERKCCCSHYTSLRHSTSALRTTTTLVIATELVTSPGVSKTAAPTKEIANLVLKSGEAKTPLDKVAATASTPFTQETEFTPTEQSPRGTGSPHSATASRIRVIPATAGRTLLHSHDGGGIGVGSAHEVGGDNDAKINFVTAIVAAAAVLVAAATATLTPAAVVHVKRRLNGLNKHSWIFLLIYLNLSAKFCIAGYHEKRLLHDLLDPYNTLERPVLNESDPLQLSFGLTLMQIIDVDEKNQLLITNIWLKLEWNDMNLRWNTSDYGGVKDLRIPPHRIWKPDVLMYNSADEGFDGTYPTNVVVRSNGSCLYVPPGIFKSTCKIDITWFPFDDQRCEMKFGSWTYDGFQLDLQLQDEAGGDISSYVMNGEWDLLGVPGKRNEIYYNCCPEPYIDITFAILIRRRTLYYFFNLIVPCVLIASMALLGFTLPPDSGEKLSLGVTILLSLTVFLNMVAETMPATSDAVPLLGTYFNCIMFMVASSVVSTILILNYHHRNADTHEMSDWIRVVFLYWLPCILRMSRPGRPLTLDFPTTPCSDSSSERKHQILSDVELKERSSKSLLANVLDIDDDFRHNCRPLTPGGTLPHNPAFYRTVYGQGDDGSIGPIGSTRMPDAITQHTCMKSSTDYELGLILKEIRFITDQLRKEDEESEIANDWKFAAMVVDRLCLIIFTMFTILATIAVLFSAPHIIVS